jgi:four helix bundle protein
MKVGKRPTSNVQRSTFNEEADAEPVFDLEERLLEYAARIIRLVDSLPATRAGNHVAGQLLRSGTSPLPNHGEAQAAESRADFIHKPGICHKELRESRRWLRLIKRVPLIKPPAKLDPLIDETVELIKIFWASIRTAERDENKSTRICEDAPAREEQPSALNVERWKLDVERSPKPSPRKRIRS